MGVHIVNLISLGVLFVGTVRFVYKNTECRRSIHVAENLQDLSQHLMERNVSEVMPFTQKLVQFLGNGYGILCFTTTKLAANVCYVLLLFHVSGVAKWLSFLNDFGEGTTALVLGFWFCPDRT